MLLLKLIRLPAAFGFEIGIQAIITCLEVYGVIFVVILLVNIRKVYKAKPIELLKAENAGEREPKAKWLMALIGFICLFAGYYIAVTTESPLSALALFFCCRLAGYGRNLSALYCRKHCNPENHALEQEILL